MTKKILAFTLLFFLIISCAKREDEAENEQYVGVWNWVSTDGGIANEHQTPANTGITRTMDLTVDYHYSIKENGIPVSEGTYSISPGVTNTDHSEKIFINFSNYPSVFVQSVNASDLYLVDDSIDGFNYHYSK